MTVWNQVMKKVVQNGTGSNMKILLYFILCLPIFSCDPYRRFQMINATEDDAVVTFIIKEDSLHSSPFFISNTKESAFIVHPGRAGRIHLSCGEGEWTVKQVAAIADDLESIIIKWNEGETKLETQEQITDFLVQRRKGLDKGKIVLLIPG